MNPYTSLTLYRWKKGAPAFAKFAPGGNFVVDDFDAFVSENFDWAYGWAESTAFPKFPRVDMKVKVNSVPSPNAGLENYTGNMPGYSYLTFEYNEAYQAGSAESNSSRLYRYFVVGERRISSESVELTLKMDVLNTFRPGLSGGTPFKASTLVVREHRDRFVPGKTSGGAWNGKVLRKIDDADEGFSVPTFVKSRGRIEEAKTYLDQKCYLVYKASATLTPDNLENPLKCYLAYEKGIPGGVEQVPSETEVKLAGVSEYSPRVVCFYKWQNPDLKNLKLLNNRVNPDVTPTYLDYSIDGDAWDRSLGILITLGGNVAGVAVYYIDYFTIVGGEISVVKTDSLTPEPTDVVPPGSGSDYSQIIADNLNYRTPIWQGRFTDSDFVPWLLSLSFPSGFVKGNGSGVTMMASMAQVDRYDSRNVKIVALPYSPIEWVVGLSGYEPPTGWSLDGTTGLLSPADLDGPFQRKIGSSFIVSEASCPDYPSTYSEDNAGLPRNDAYESKRYNSSFYSLSFSYGSFSLPFRLEKAEFSFDGTQSSQTAAINLYYRQSAAISSKLAFSLASDPSSFDGLLSSPTAVACEIDYNPEEQWPIVLVCARNNELPIFTSDYLNYVRGGYNYDVKSNQLALGSDIVDTLIGAGKGAADVAAAGSGEAMAAAGATEAFSTARRVSNLIFNSLQRDNALDKSLRVKAMSAIGIEGSDDLDLFEWFTGNKLWWFRAEPTPTTLRHLLDYFHYFGYATNERKVPSVHTRINFNYLQCEAEFSEEQALGAEISDELKAKCRAGITYLWHTSAGWDFEGVRANLETWAATGIIEP